MGVIEAKLAWAADGEIGVRFLSPMGSVLPADWQPEPAVPTFFVIHGFQARGTDAPCLRQQDRHGAANLAAVRRLALSLLRQKKTNSGFTSPACRPFFSRIHMYS
jgi:hypothetical protein